MTEQAPQTESFATLDPPGKIIVVGAGPVGLEAALYGRFLGYDVRIIEAVAVAASWCDAANQPLSGSPDRSVSSLAKSAIAAHDESAMSRSMPTTVGQWINDLLIPLAETDLLRGRLLIGTVTGIDAIAVAPDSPVEQDDADEPAMATGDEQDDQIPADFRLTLSGCDQDFIDCEALILTPADSSAIRFGVDHGADYLFEIARSAGEASSDWKDPRGQITRLYASLGGRSTLDLYRPDRS